MFELGESCLYSFGSAQTSKRTKNVEFFTIQEAVRTTCRSTHADADEERTSVVIGPIERRICFHRLLDKNLPQRGTALHDQTQFKAPPDLNTPQIIKNTNTFHCRHVH